MAQHDRADHDEQQGAEGDDPGHEQPEEGPDRPEDDRAGREPRAGLDAGDVLDQGSRRARRLAGDGPPLIRMRARRVSVLLVNGRRTFRVLRPELERFKAAHVMDSVTDDWE